MCRPDGMAERRRVRPSAIEQRAGSDPPSSSSSPSTTAHQGFMALHGLLMIGRRSRAPVRLPCHVEPVQLSRSAVTRGRGLHSAARVHSKGGGSGDGDGRDPWRGRCVALPARSVAPLQSAFSALCWQRGSGGGEGAFLLCGGSFSAPALRGRSTGRLRQRAPGGQCSGRGGRDGGAGRQRDVEGGKDTARAHYLCTACC